MKGEILDRQEESAGDILQRHLRRLAGGEREGLPDIENSRVRIAANIDPALLNSDDRRVLREEGTILVIPPVRPKPLDDDQGRFVERPKQLDRDTQARLAVLKIRAAMVEDLERKIGAKKVVVATPEEAPAIPASVISEVPSTPAKIIPTDNSSQVQAPSIETHHEEEKPVTPRIIDLKRPLQKPRIVPSDFGHLAAAVVLYETGKWEEEKEL